MNEKMILEEKSRSIQTEINVLNQYNDFFMQMIKVVEKSKMKLRSLDSINKSLQRRIYDKLKSLDPQIKASDFEPMHKLTYGNTGAKTGKLKFYGLAVLKIKIWYQVSFNEINLEKLKGYEDKLAKGLDDDLDNVLLNNYHLNGNSTVKWNRSKKVYIISIDILDSNDI